ncbi:MAG: phenylalanine--tRNA ligase subunit beta [Desulfovibrio sp.]|nr:phenylalanine--tRNA ligase subunit beta [Desulfovibrio sp.]
MLLSLSWLREFTPYEGTAEALGDRLTMLGLELEELKNPFAGLEGILTAHVVECEMHPDSDHLHCCRVDAGQGELLDIVCGAPNVAAGQKVAVAPVGSRLPDGTLMKKAKLRGKPSFGMICSERELGLSEDHSGIMVLPEDTPVGRRLVDVLKLDTEVLDLSITPNRADCLSVLGIARETAMAFDLPLTIPDLPIVEDAVLPPVEVPVDVIDPELCWLYAGRVVSDISVKPSPMRIRHRLHAVGVRAISNIVDVTNYILFECGQPLHSFDLDKLAGGRIVVRPAADKEEIVTLDGQARILNPRDLCICDTEKPVALAGVMGGLNSEISDGTRNVFIESAVFRPGTIRKTSRRLGLSSESSFRFERGIDQARSRWSLDRACAMMAGLGGGRVRRGMIAVEPKPFVAVKIDFHPEKADALLGIHLDADFDEKVLSAMGCAIEKGKDAWKVDQPSWRPDLTREADLIEEVGRVHGLDNIPPALPPVRQALDHAAEPESTFSFWLRLRRWGAGIGLNEAINYSFVGHKELDLLGLPAEGRISIMNPLSAEQDALRTALAPGLLYALRNNLAQGAQTVKLFELANIFAADDLSETTARETGMLGILLYGNRNEVAWPHEPGDMEYADLKGLVEHLMRFLHLPGLRCERCETVPYLLPGVAVCCGGRRIGTMGRVKPQIAAEYLARRDVWLAELDLGVLRELHDAAQLQFAPLAAFPPVRRDITIMAGRGVSVASVLDSIAAMKLPLLEDTVLVDLFEPDDSEERNLTFRLTFRHADRTLKDAEVDKEREKVAKTLVQELGVRV